MKPLSKAEGKKLIICRERVQDACFRVNDISEILEKREWPQAQELREAVHYLNTILVRVERLEKEYFKTKKD